MGSEGLTGALAPLRGVAAFLAAGGPVVWWIFAAAVWQWTLIGERWLFYRFGAPRLAGQLQARWQARPERASWRARWQRRGWLSEARGWLYGPLPLLRVVIPLAPLLGLYGTVAAMLEVFDVMVAHGAADPAAMAAGISHAMVATLSGLTVALAGLYFAHHYEQRARRTDEAFATLLGLEALAETADRSALDLGPNLDPNPGPGLPPDRGPDAGPGDWLGPGPGHGS